MKKMEVLEEEEGNVWEKIMEKADLIRGFKLRFIGANENSAIHRVEVRNLNFQDVMRHLQRGESVLITPKSGENSSINVRKQEERTPWYFTHI